MQVHSIFDLGELILGGIFQEFSHQRQEKMIAGCAHWLSLCAVVWHLMQLLVPATDVPHPWSWPRAVWLHPVTFLLAGGRGASEQWVCLNRACEGHVGLSV